MVKWINSWTQGIIIAVIISTIIEMILPEGKLKKYIIVVIGTYIVFVILSPIISKITGKEINLNIYEIPDNITYKTETIDTNAYIESAYINNIKQEIIKDIEEKGFEVKDIQIEIEKEEEHYGNINKISLKLNEKTNTNSDFIEPINIDINNKKNEKEKKVSNEDISKIKELLKENYGTKIENIEIK